MDEHFRRCLKKDTEERRNLVSGVTSACRCPPPQLILSDSVVVGSDDVRGSQNVQGLEVHDAPLKRKGPTFMFLSMVIADRQGGPPLGSHLNR